MINIYVNGGSLDLYSDAQIDISWVNYRFSESVTEEYTQDFSIPATRNNLRLLDCDAILYTPYQRFGREISQVEMTVGSETYSCRIQVLEISDTEIKICVFVNVIPFNLKDKKLRDILVDDADTIIPLSASAPADYQEFYKYYNYGMYQNFSAAIFHPSLPVNPMLGKISTLSNVKIQQFDTPYYVMASRKVVCPQNHVQYWKLNGDFDDNNILMKVKGSQHITNDVDSEDKDFITINRDCNLVIRLTTAYSMSRGQKNFSAYLQQYRDDDTHMEDFVIKNRYPIIIYGQSYDQYLETHAAITVVAKKGDKIRFNFSNKGSAGKFRFFTALARVEITDYIITDDDYDTELEYIHERMDFDFSNAFPKTFTRDGDYLEMTSTHNTYHDTEIKMYYPKLYWNFFGIYSNIPDIKVTDFLANIAFLTGEKLRFTNNSILHVRGNESAELKKFKINYTSPTSDSFGQNNYILYADEDIEYKGPITKINSTFLEDEKVLKELPFEKNYNKNESSILKLPQYKNPEQDDDGYWSCDYTELEGIVLCRYNSTGNYLIPIKDTDKNDLDKITYVVESEVETTDYDANDKDFYYINGIKFLCLEGSYDTNEKVYKIKLVKLG